MRWNCILASPHCHVLQQLDLFITDKSTFRFSAIVTRIQILKEVKSLEKSYSTSPSLSPQSPGKAVHRVNLSSLPKLWKIYLQESEKQFDIPDFRKSMIKIVKIKDHVNFLFL